MRQSDGTECTSDWIGQFGLKLRRDALPIYCKTEWMLLYNLNIAGSVMCVYKWKARKIKWIRRLPCKQFGLNTLLKSSKLVQQFWKRVCAAGSSELNARLVTSLHINFSIQKLLDVAWYLSIIQCTRDTHMSALMRAWTRNVSRCFFRQLEVFIKLRPYEGKEDVWYDQSQMSFWTGDWIDGVLDEGFGDSEEWSERGEICVHVETRCAARCHSFENKVVAWVITVSVERVERRRTFKKVW